MKERAFNARAHEVRGLLDGRVTQLRRVVTGNLAINQFTYWGPIERLVGGHRRSYADLRSADGRVKAAAWCPLGQPGDRLWCREAWAAVWPDDCEVPLQECRIEYRVDLPADRIDDGPGHWPADCKRDRDAPSWRSSTQMPRWASRITLEVLDVRVQRLQDISCSDVFAEGIEAYAGCSSTDEQAGWDPIEHYAELWNAHNKRHPWASNPWTWVARIKVLEVRR